jgi:Fe2+ or Zn2+ uptake regulation protein
MDKCTPETLLGKKRIKMTKQRNVVLQTIIDNDSPFCASDLYKVLSEDMDLATLYRNIEMLFLEGIIREVMNERERHYYELACVHNPEHPHFCCNRCGQIYCMKQKKVKPFHVEVCSGKNFIVQNTTIQLRGFCPKCC